MSQVAIGMGKAPLRHGVGGKALVEDHDRRFHPRILEVGVELPQELRHYHALVDDGARRQGRDIEHRVAGFQPFFGAAARHIELAVEGGLIELAARVDEHLLDGRQGLERLRPTGVGIHRQRPEARDLQFLELQLFGENLSRMSRQTGIPIEEHQAGGKQRRQCEPRFRGRGLEEGGRLLDQQPATIAGLAVRGYRSAMGQPIERADGGLQYPMTGLIVETRDQTEPTRVSFIGRPVKAPIPNARVRAVEAGLKCRNIAICHTVRP
jgi:hypothetical protein